MHGEPARLYWRRRKVRLRPLILILDISGSMADYSRSLLQFAHSAARSAGRVEVFCFGTRLTRVTGAMECRRPDEALERAARAAFDWDGGTRIGDSLDAFVRDWARRGLCRGGIVVICSDGLDRGDPAVLAAAMERLARLSHRLVWLNPHKGDDPGFRPSTLGMMIAAPHIDLLLSGHDLASLEKLAALLPRMKANSGQYLTAIRIELGSWRTDTRRSAGGRPKKAGGYDVTVPACCAASARRRLLNRCQEGAVEGHARCTSPAGEQHGEPVPEAEPTQPRHVRLMA